MDVLGHELGEVGAQFGAQLLLLRRVFEVHGPSGGSAALPVAVVAAVRVEPVTGIGKGREFHGELPALGLPSGQGRARAPIIASAVAAIAVRAAVR
ncbi:hypothetical protein GCM10017750_60280 [Streptomyces racemochromogenes]